MINPSSIISPTFLKAFDSFTSGLNSSGLNEGELSSLDTYLQGLASSVGAENELNRIFNAEQAQLNRSFQERMANTAYQRAVNDLQAAGLNPLLALTGGGSSSATAGQPSGNAASYQVGGGDTASDIGNTIAALINAIGNTASAIADFLPRITIRK